VSELIVTDLSHEPKWRTFTDPGGFSWSVSPGEWTLLGARPGGEHVDLTSVRAMFRLTGDDARNLLSKICALDFSDGVFPDGSAARTLVAGVATEIVRDDQDAVTSYLLLPSRSFGRFMDETIRDAGLEFGLNSP
jgi:heterotetrameric sarcosine oxidase gamma subunit